MHEPAMHEHGGKKCRPAAHRIGNGWVDWRPEQTRGHHAIAEYRGLLCDTQRYLPIKDAYAQTENDIGDPRPLAGGIVVADGQEKHATRCQFVRCRIDRHPSR